MKSKKFVYGKYTIEIQPNTAKYYNWVIYLYMNDIPLLIYYNELDIFFILKGKYKGEQSNLFKITLALKKLGVSFKIINKLFVFIYRCKKLKNP